MRKGEEKGFSYRIIGCEEGLTWEERRKHHKTKPRKTEGVMPTHNSPCLGFFNIHWGVWIHISGWYKGEREGPP